jgi:hypothetical protein
VLHFSEAVLSICQLHRSKIVVHAQSRILSLQKDFRHRRSLKLVFVELSGQQFLELFRQQLLHTSW